MEDGKSPPELRNWYVCDLNNTVIYTGNIYGWPRYTEGKKIYTGTVFVVDDEFANEPEGFIIVETMQGTQFLCKMSEKKK